MGRVVSESVKQRLSLARSKYLEEVGNGGYASVRWYDVCNFKGEWFVVRGLLELDIALLLNQEGRYWVRRTYLNYVTVAGCVRTYTPDFYLPDEDLYIEAKGFFSDLDRYKLQAVCELNCVNLAIVFVPWRKISRETFIGSSWIGERSPSNRVKRKRPCVRSRSCVDCGNPCTSIRCQQCSNARAKRYDWPPVTELNDLLRMHSYTHTGQILSVSPTSIRRHFAALGIPRPPAIYRCRNGCGA